MRSSEKVLYASVSTVTSPMRSSVSSKISHANFTAATLKRVKSVSYERTHFDNTLRQHTSTTHFDNTRQQHTRRANYQATIWRHHLINSPDIHISSVDHEWIASQNDIPVIKWMTGSSAPEVVLSLLTSVLDLVGHLTAHASPTNSNVQKSACCLHAPTWRMTTKNFTKTKTFRLTVMMAERP